MGGWETSRHQPFSSTTVTWLYFFKAARAKSVREHLFRQGFNQFIRGMQIALIAFDIVEKCLIAFR
jgi:hypothetical protein